VPHGNRWGVALALAVALGACSSGGSHTSTRSKPKPAPLTSTTAAPGAAGTTTTAAGGAPSSTAAPAGGGAPRGLGSFVGSWSGHGRGLIITADGRGTASWRIYRLCTDDPAPPCDGTGPNGITDGGRADLTITSTSGATATGRVDATTDASFLARGPVTLELQPGDQLVLSPGGTVFCGPSASAGTCGG
jgi:hypothetical protein